MRKLPDQPFTALELQNQSYDVNINLNDLLILRLQNGKVPVGSEAKHRLV